MKDFIYKSVKWLIGLRYEMYMKIRIIQGVGLCLEKN